MLEVLELQPHASEPDDEPYLDLSSVEAILGSRYLGKLRELHLRLCSAGDQGIERLVASPLLRQLELLDLAFGEVTDEGARLLATALGSGPHRLKHLDLSHNALTPRGQELLQALGIPCELHSQYSPDQIEEREYLWYGNIE